MGIEIIIRRHRIAIGLLLCGVILVTPACDYKKNSKAHEPRIPYPDEGALVFLQDKVDSSQFLWYCDVKAMASAFCNEELRPEEGVSTADIVILNESLYHALVEVRLPDKTLILTLERPFKHKGKDSIWRVMKMEEKSGD